MQDVTLACFIVEHHMVPSSQQLNMFLQSSSNLMLFNPGIRDYIISNAKCVCGATNILADDLLPNKTLRDTINRILESGNSSAENAGSTFQVQGLFLYMCVYKCMLCLLACISYFLF